VTRKRVLRSPGAAWVAAALGAWLTAASCRTIQPPVSLPAGAAAPALPEGVAAIAPPVVRIGILVDAGRASIGADAGVRVLARVPGSTKPRAWVLPRATFLPGAAAGRLRLLETGADLELATVASVSAAELLQVDASRYRGLIEVRPGSPDRLTVVNVANLEDYLRGVVPNELSPEAFPQIEALKAQAVAARTYALAHLGDYSARGFDLCATAACQVYRGADSEQPLTDRAITETQRIVATWHGKPINAYYTSTCGGHTEDGSAIFDDDAPYLRGVVCLPEQSARHTIHTTAAPRPELPGGGRTTRDLALLAALGVTEARDAEPERLRGIPTDAEIRGWTRRLLTAAHRTGCPSPVGGALARRATLAVHAVASLCWDERAERLLGPADADYLLQATDASRLTDPAERRAVALLVHEGLLSPQPDGALRPDQAVTRAEALDLVAGLLEKAGAPDFERGQLAGLEGAQLSVLHGEDEPPESRPLDPAVLLFRNLEGVHAAAAELTLAVGEQIAYVVSGGRVVFLEAEQTRRGAAADRASRYYEWEVRMTPAEVAKAVSRYGSVGVVRDVEPRRLGVSGRVVQLAVLGSDGDLLLKGMRVRWGLGLRENLFVIDREKDAGGAVESFVFTGKGWGHGVGLCQVGAFGMAQAGSTFEAILKHYYTGIELSSEAQTSATE
jgi:peptidoglycan hydrolase-like amidase